MLYILILNIKLEKILFAKFVNNIFSNFNNKIKMKRKITSFLLLLVGIFFIYLLIKVPPKQTDQTLKDLAYGFFGFMSLIYCLFAILKWKKVF